MQKHFPKNISLSQWHETLSKDHLVELSENCDNDTESTTTKIDLTSESSQDDFCTTHGQMFGLHDLLAYIHETDISEDCNNLNLFNVKDLVLIKSFICQFIRKIFAKHAQLNGICVTTCHTTPSKLLAAVDSLELHKGKNSNISENNICCDITSEQSTATTTTTESEIISPNAKKPNQTNAIIYDHITVDDYIDSFRKVPPYMLSENRQIPSIWDYKPVTDNEWTEIINGIKSSKKLKSVQNCIDNQNTDRKSGESSKKVRVCRLSEDIPVRSSDGLKKIDTDQTPTRSILRISKCQTDSIDIVKK